MLISKKQINQLLIYTDCYKDLLFKMQNNIHTEYSLEIENFLATIENQQDEDLRVIE
jgi:hypothetical protein